MPRNKTTILVILTFVIITVGCQSSKETQSFTRLNTELPNPLEYFDGSPIKTKEDWNNRRRPEILSLFKENIYGTVPYDIDISSQFVLE